MIRMAVAGGMAALTLLQGTASRRRLEAPQVIDGVSCAATGKAFAEFHASGRLKECPIAGDTTIAGHAFKAGTWVMLADDRGLDRAWLSENTSLDGHLCRGTGYKGWSVEFHANGKLRLCFLAEVTEIGGVVCQRGTFWNEVRGGGKSAVRFRADGSIESCQAASDASIGSVRVRKWDRVQFDAAGRISGPG